MSEQTDYNTRFLGGVPHTTQTVAVGVSSLASAVAIPKGAYVRLSATAACHIKLGASAATTDMYLPANTVDVIHMGTATSIHTIRNDGDGFLFITELGGPGTTIDTSGDYGG